MRSCWKAASGRTTSARGAPQDPGRRLLQSTDVRHLRRRAARHPLRTAPDHRLRGTSARPDVLEGSTELLATDGARRIALRGVDGPAPVPSVGHPRLGGSRGRRPNRSRHHARRRAPARDIDPLEKMSIRGLTIMTLHQSEYLATGGCVAEAMLETFHTSILRLPSTSEYYQSVSEVSYRQIASHSESTGVRSKILAGFCFCVASACGRGMVTSDQLTGTGVFSDKSRTR